MQSKKQFWLVCLCLALITFGVFLPVIHCDFINYDDPAYVTENNVVQQGLTWEGIVWAFESGHIANWHPLTWLSHMLDVQIFGMSAGGHHFTNLVFHVANTLLLFSILTMATGALWRSAMVAVLFALHPLHIESVAWISERKDVLSTFFLMLSLGAYFRYAKTRSSQREAELPRRRGSYFLALIFFALGLMAKPMLVTLPFLLLLLDLWPLERFSFSHFDAKSFRALLFEKLPFLALTFLFSTVTFLAQKGAMLSLVSTPLSFRISNMLVAYCRYVAKLIWPTDLSILYPLQPWPAPIIFLAGLFLILVSFTAIRTVSRRPYFAVGWFWFLGTLVPVIGIVQVGVQSMADRYTYIPSIGLFIAVVWAIRDFPLNNFPRFLSCLAAVAIIGCVVTTSLNLRYWKNSILLFEHALAVTKRNYIAHNNLGTALKEEGRRDEAMKHFEIALQLLPNYANARYNIAKMLGDEGKTEEAIAGYEDTLRMNPDFGPAHYNLGNALMRKGEIIAAIACYRAALKADPNDAEAHNNLASALQRQGEIPKAMEHFQEAIRLRPGYPEAHFNLALILIRQERTSEAIGHLNKALRLQPENEQAHYQLGILLVGQRQMESAIAHFRAALRLKPESPATLNFLARILATSRDSKVRNGEEAVRLAEHVCKLSNFENFAYLDTMGAAFAEKGDFAEAIRAAQKAKETAMVSGQKIVGEQIELHIRQYQSGQPLREF